MELPLFIKESIDRLLFIYLSLENSNSKFYNNSSDTVLQFHK